jgi:hypothetical protein
VCGIVQGDWVQYPTGRRFEIIKQPKDHVMPLTDDDRAELEDRRKKRSQKRLKYFRHHNE